jgi:hypothetical protein
MGWQRNLLSRANGVAALFGNRALDRDPGWRDGPPNVSSSRAHCPGTVVAPSVLSEHAQSLVFTANLFLQAIVVGDAAAPGHPPARWSRRKSLTSRNAINRSISSRSSFLSLARSWRVIFRLRPAVPKSLLRKACHKHQSNALNVHFRTVAQVSVIWLDGRVGGQVSSFVRSRPCPTSPKRASLPEAAR